MCDIMIEAGENLTELDEYRKVETDFWEGQDRSGDLGTSQRTRVLELLVPKLRKVSLAEGFTAYDFGDRLSDAEHVVDDIAYALCAFWEQKERRSGLGPAHKSGRIWYKPDLSCLNLKPDDWEDVSPVNIDRLDKATAEYLRRPWMQLNALDWCVLNGYIFDETARTGDGIKSGQAMGIINWPYILGGVISRRRFIIRSDGLRRNSSGAGFGPLLLSPPYTISVTKLPHFGLRHLTASTSPFILRFFQCDIGSEKRFGRNIRTCRRSTKS